MADVRFAKNEAGDVVLIRGEERTVLGRLDAVGEEMCRFLADVDFGECPSQPVAPAPDILRARAAAAHYHREQGREQAAEATERGEDDSDGLVRAMLWVLEGRT